MNKTNTSLFTLAFLFAATPNSFGFGHKKMQVSELKGVTETQVAAADGKGSVMVRGKAAELLFRTMKQQQEEQTDTDALKWIGAKDGAEVTVRGKQVTCSKISKKTQEDYACAFNLETNGTVAAAADVYNPSTFNLARTATGSKVFKKKNRAIASVAAPSATYSKGQAYLVYDEPGKQKTSETALIVFRGDSAKEILTMLEDDKGSDMKDAHWGEAKGRRGQDIACVHALGKEPERCAVVVTFKDGSVTRSGNPLFR
ncbi:MAG: hypothetical protein ACXVB9_09885 [Bdellovibrionota bacterium]